MSKTDRELLMAAIVDLMDRMGPERLRLLYITALAWAGGEK